MQIRRSNWNDFIEVVQKQTYQNQDILEARQFGYKSIEDAFKDAELPWARFYIVEDRKGILATILEQRDGVIILFTTTNLQKSNLREYIRTVKKLGDDIVECRDVIFIQVASWHKPALRLLKLTGFEPHIKHNHIQIWVKENGKQN